jgi:hypothetical protein
MAREIETRRKAGAKALEPVLHAFTELVWRSADADVDAAPYLYREKTLVGVVGAAAWGLGGSSIWELPTDKGRAHTRRAGRADLLLWTPTGPSYVFEAKRDEHQLPDDFGENDVDSWARRVLAAACRDARATPRSLADHRAGLAFLVPVFSSDRAGKSSVERFLDAAAGCEWDIWCWAPCRECVRDEDAGVALPGVLLLGRFC